MTSPNVSGASHVLNAVTAVSATDAWAVGYYQTPTASRALVEHWNGVAWRLVGSPAPPGSELKGIAALSVNDVWAVGVASTLSAPVH